jgi:L-serine dehydratase
MSALSIREVFRIGIGPSSSHTVGPMRAARQFLLEFGRDIDTVDEVTVELYGSLALTGRGHRTDDGLVLGLCGLEPETVDPQDVPRVLEQVRSARILALLGRRAVPFIDDQHIVFHRTRSLAGHPNAMRFSARTVAGTRTAVYYSIGGGTVRREGQGTSAAVPHEPGPVHAYDSAARLVELCVNQGLSIAQVMLVNQSALEDEPSVLVFIEQVRLAMLQSIERGSANDGVLPGGLGIRRRAPALRRRLLESPAGDPAQVLDWVSLYALAVNEENAAGARVVTAPTNGSAGVIPAVLKYYEGHVPGADAAGSRDLLLTAGAIGALFKEKASVSAAEMGCQGEIGVSCSMAAAGLTAALGGTPSQVENAAEIALEHHLGLTCDPVAGLVQVPCIERNALAAVKAIQSSRLALAGDGEHLVSLDAAIETMRQTGLDMAVRYKETSLGGLAVNVIHC